MLWPRRVQQLIERIVPDVVHTHSGVWYKASLAARRAGVRWLVHTDHGRLVPDPWQARLVDRLASRRTDVIVAVSQPLAQRLRAGVVANPERIRVVINGVDTDELRPGGAADLRRDLDLADGVVVIGSVGRLESIKGYDVMLESLAELVRLDPTTPALLIIAGDGAERPTLELLARERGLGDRVRFLGWRGDLPRLLATFDLFALTSRSEGTSVSLLEAMSAGVCPVVTDVGGNADVIGPTLRHRLAPAEDPRAIARLWLAALRDPVGRARDGASARHRAMAHFSLRAMVAQYEAIYAEGMSSRA
jgi:glycosyltransferase involved in cell wall biosynthesis